MKLTLAIAAALIGSANAFSAVAPNGNAAAAVDHSLKGIDDGAAHDVFDPTAGDNAALTRNNKDDVWVPQRARPRRNRKSAAVRAMLRENIVTPANFIYPLFIHEEDFNTAIPSMPGCERHSLDHMLVEVEEAMRYGVKTFVLFPKVPDELKTNLGVEAYNPNGIVPRAVSMIKDKFPEGEVKRVGVQEDRFSMFVVELWISISPNVRRSPPLILTRR